MGERLVVDGATMKICDLTTRYIYETRPSIEDGSIEAEPLSCEESAKWAEVCSLLPWSRYSDSRQFQGWVAVAILCGSIRWRPSVWIDGSSGSGKSWVFDNIVKPMLGGFGMYCQGATTEAGIRQQIRSDAMPVLIDELELDHQGRKGSIEGILTLMRQASSSTNAKIHKGTKDGRGIEYEARSCFYFTSTGSGAENRADQSRIQLLTLRQEDDADTAAKRFKKLQDTVQKVLTKEWCASFRARSIANLKVIERNANVFSDCIAPIVKSKRGGDQIGILYAGAYSAEHDGEISEEDAKKYIEIEDWSGEIEKAGDTDEKRCLSRILQEPIRVEVKENVYVNRTDGELIATFNGSADANVESGMADRCLRRLGIRVADDGKHVLFAKKSQGIVNILSETPWGSNYSHQLERLPNSKADRKLIRFVPGLFMRAVTLDMDTVLGVSHGEPEESA
jgi:putative DNA primase/helicase